ncbi:VIT1/CCC1 transporter family protein [Streptosporangium lutulentum]
MAGGEYVSVASQRELALAEIDVERSEIERHPEAEQEELAKFYEGRGVDPVVAAEVARQISLDPVKALEAHASAELGVTLEDLPSPKTAALSSFLAFSVGALLPLLPYLLGVTGLVTSAVVSCVALFGAGALVSRVTARSWWYSGLRQLVVGVIAASLTFTLGNLLGGS